MTDSFQKASKEGKPMRETPSSTPQIRCFWLLFFFGIILSACKESVNTLTLKELQKLPLPVAVYSDIVWLDEETIVLMHRPPQKPVDEEVLDTFDDFQIGLYRLDTNEFNEVPLPIPPDYCVHKAGQPKRLRSVPGVLFGFVYLCVKKSGPITSILYLWDREQNLMVEYATYPKPLGDSPRGFKAGRFSFAPDMSSLILEGNSGLSPQLYLVDANSKMTQLFPEFERTAVPSRSPNGQTIAFGGNESYDFRTDDPKTWLQMNKVYWSLFDLYLMDADGSDARLVLPQAGSLGGLTWSPDGEHLLFGGRSPWGKEGIWMLHLDTLEATRIWPYSTNFALSPDGRRIVIQDKEKTGVYQTPTELTIYALPEVPRN